MSLMEYLGLELKAEDRLAQDDLERISFLREMQLDKTGVVLVTGQQRTGKTTWGASLAWMRREYFGYPVVSNVVLKDAFGEYEYLDTAKLVEEMEKVNKVVDKAVKGKENERIKRVAEEAWGAMSIKLRRATILLDEGYAAFERRRGMSPKLLLYSYLVQQWGHYESLIVVMATSRELLDSQRINPFATHEVTCGHVKEMATSLYMVFDRREAVEPDVNPRPQTIYVPNWSPLFDTHAPVAVPRDILKSALKAEGLKAEGLL